MKIEVENDIEADAVYAGLRMLQRAIMTDSLDLEFQMIATGQGGHRLIAPEEIERITERIDDADFGPVTDEPT